MLQVEWMSDPHASRMISKSQPRVRCGISSDVILIALLRQAISSQVLNRTTRRTAIATRCGKKSTETWHLGMGRPPANLTPAHCALLPQPLQFVRVRYARGFESAWVSSPWIPCNKVQSLRASRLGRSREAGAKKSRTWQLAIGLRFRSINRRKHSPFPFDRLRAEASFVPSFRTFSGHTQIHRYHHQCASHRAVDPCALWCAHQCH